MKNVILFLYFLCFFLGSDSYAFNRGHSKLDLLVNELRITHDFDGTLEEFNPYYEKAETDFESHIHLYMPVYNDLISFAKAIKIVFPNIVGFKILFMKNKDVHYSKIRPIWTEPSDNRMKDRPLAFKLMETIFGKWGSNEGLRFQLNIIDKSGSNGEQYSYPTGRYTKTSFFMEATLPKIFRTVNPSPFVMETIQDIPDDKFTFSVFVESNTERTFYGWVGEEERERLLDSEIYYMEKLVHELIHVAGWVAQKRPDSKSGEELRTKILENKILIELLRSRNIKPLFIEANLIRTSQDRFYCEEDERTKCNPRDLAQLRSEIEDLKELVSSDYQQERLKKEARKRKFENLVQQIFKEAEDFCDLP